MIRPNLPGETWLPTHREGYDVSDQGRVWSQKTERILVTWYWGDNPHPMVALGRGRKKLVHHLVLEAFRGPCSPGEMGLHWDDDPDNNRLENLRWDTKSANGHDAARNGRNGNTNKDRCPQDHEYTKENIWWYRGWRYCRQCRRNRSKSKKQSTPTL